ncbi:hypothetical protein V6145_14820, partial [Klebsiella pneumoniae]|uniref:hypothetical protein n=2 Tax=Klebsiella TaxID=570 RepID=UPI001D0DE086
ADRNRSHWSTSKTPSYTKSVSWHHHPESIASNAVVSESFLANYVAFIDLSGILIILQYFFAASHLVRVSASEMFG